MRFRILLLALPLLFAGCGEKKDDGGEAYDEALLAQYRSAIPNEDRLTADTPDAGGTKAVADTVIPNAASGAVADSNNAVHSIVNVMKTVTSLPPSQFNSDTKEFLWGPWDNNNGYGQVAVYIVENQPDAEGNAPDFKYSYAWVRTTPDGDWANAMAVVWGAATPDPVDENRGVGITLWDWVANADFENTFNPEPPADLGEGRFVTTYGHFDVLDDPEVDSIAFNYAVLRGFGSPENPGGVSLDLFYGKIIGADGNSISFLDWQQIQDMCDTAGQCFEDYDTGLGSNGDEQLDISLVFYNDGIGRGELDISGGDFLTAGATPPLSAHAVECWDAAIMPTVLAYEDSDGNSWSAPAGTLPSTDCIAPFTVPLADLGMPSLDGIDAEDRDAIACAAENGLGNCP